MTAEEAERLECGVTRLRHRSGAEGRLVGFDNGDFRRPVVACGANVSRPIDWRIEDCEVAS